MTSHPDPRRILIVIAALLAFGSATTQAFGATLAYVKDDVVYAAQTNGSGATVVARPAGDVRGVAIAGKRIYYSQLATATDSTCDLYDTTKASALFIGDALGATVTPDSGALCDIVTGADGSVFFTASAGTLGSLTTWMLNPGTGAKSEVNYGYGIAPGAPGKPSVLLAHLYRGGPVYGSYEMLLTGVVGQTTPFTRLGGLAAGTTFSYGPVALSPGGRELATFRGGPEDTSNLFEGPLGRRLHGVMTVPAHTNPDTISWLPHTNDVLAGLTSSGRTTEDVYEISPTGQRRRILSGVSAFAVG